MKKMEMPEIKVNQVDGKFKASLRSRIIVAAVLLAIIVPCSIIGSWPFFIAISIASCIAIWEMCASTGKKPGWWVIVASYIITLSYIYWPIIKSCLMNGMTVTDFFYDEYFKTIEISTLGVAASIFAYFAIAIFDKNFSWTDVAHYSTFSLLIGLGVQSIFFLRYSPFFFFTDASICTGMCIPPSNTSTLFFRCVTSFLFTLFVVFGACINDTYCYFGGVFFGRHKLNERISPKKTWEGFGIGLILTAITMTGIGLGLAASGNPVLPFLDLKNWYWVVAFSFIIPLVGDLGDLSLSLIKRHYGIKDYGNILRGHGGILDRADSIIFTAIICAVLISLINGFSLYIH